MLTIIPRICEPKRRNKDNKPGKFAKVRGKHSKKRPPLMSKCNCNTRRTDIETTHLEFFLDKKCAQQYKIAHATPVEGTTKTRVSWEPEWTDPQNIDSYPEHKAIREAFDAIYLSEARSCTQAVPPAKDEHLPNLQRQGIQPQSRWLSHLHNHKLQSMVSINLQEVNPDLDISAPDKFTIQLQTIPVVSPTQRQTDERVACCYTPDGRCIGYLEERRARMLHDRYTEAQSKDTYMESDDFANSLESS